MVDFSDSIPFFHLTGQKFAMLELKAVLSALIWNYKIISTPKTKDISYSLDLVIRPLKGMHVKLEKR